MKKINAQTIQILVLLVAVVGYCRPAHAYVDMGTGSYMVQVGIAAVAGVVFSARACWSQFVHRMSGASASRAKENPAPQTAHGE